MRAGLMIVAFVMAMGLHLHAALADGQTADRHFQDGVAHYDRGEYPAALADFRKAYDAAPDFRVLYNIAQTHYRMREVTVARATFQRYLAEGAERVPPEKQKVVRANLVELEGLVGRIRVTVDRPGARVLVDGASTGTSPLPAPIAVDPGRHDVRVELDGRAPAQASVDVTKGSEAVVSLGFPADAPPPPAPTVIREQRSPVGPVLLISGGIVLATTLFSDFVIVRSKLSDFEDLRDRDDPSAGDARATVRTLQTVTIVGYVVGALLGAAGATITFWPKPSRSGVALTGAGLVF